MYKHNGFSPKCIHSLELAASENKYNKYGPTWKSACA